MVTLLDSNGNELATCIEQSVAGPDKLAMGRVVRGKGALLKYYFAQGFRSVQIQSGGICMRGMLETSWIGGKRRWAVP